MYEYRAQVRSVYDGDTVRLDIDLGFKSWLFDVPFRLSGIDAIELGNPGGREARDLVRLLAPFGSPLTIITEKDRTEKYGRYLATLYVESLGTTSVNQHLMDLGLAVPYSGGAR
jgi:micrococcal nuclease